jgi:hypothetical protein
METEDESLSAHCARTATCARSLRVLTRDNAMTLGEEAAASPADGAAWVRQRFYQAYRCDATMLQMDAVVCSHPAAACELYLPLDLPIILFLTTRFDLGRLHSAHALRVHHRPKPQTPRSPDSLPLPRVRSWAPLTQAPVCATVCEAKCDSVVERWCRQVSQPCAHGLVRRGCDRVTVWNVMGGMANVMHAHAHAAVCWRGVEASIEPETRRGDREQCLSSGG